MIDIDHFKQFNDAHGHEGGDVLLSHIGKLLSQTVRGEDIPCRYGGEEFCLILPGATEEIMVAINLDELTSGREELNVPLQAGDVVYVARAGW